MKRKIAIKQIIQMPKITMYKFAKMNKLSLNFAAGKIPTAVYRVAAIS